MVGVEEVCNDRENEYGKGREHGTKVGLRRLFRYGISIINRAYYEGVYTYGDDWLHFGLDGDDDVLREAASL